MMDEQFVNDKRKADLAAEAGDLTGVSAFLETYRGHQHFKAPWYAEAGCDWCAAPEFNARQLIKHKHWFDSWDHYANFREQIGHDKTLQLFEQAADAVISGDLQTLNNLLADCPQLIRSRSQRNHRATLLNYVGANGVEAWRQKTPLNAADVADLLLSAGAEVDAKGDMYGGTSTLGLVATSAHPVKAGVQEPLMKVLMGYGADPNNAVAPDYTEGMLILACIHNGRGEPIHYLARHGARLDLEGSCALGDLETVKQLYDANPRKRETGLVWACVYGYIDVVDFLLEKGVPVSTLVDGTTPLHSAAFGGQLELVRHLIDLGAPMETRNEYGGTVLGTTLWCLYNDPKPAHLAIMELLISRGAVVTDDLRPYIDEVRAK
jgi:hypothetical protein